MATFLYRLGRGSFRHRRLVVLGWLAVLALAVTGALTLAGSTTDAFRIPGTPAQKAIDVLGERFPQANAGGAVARLVVAAPPGGTVTDAAHRAVVERAVADLRRLPHVATVADPFQVGTVNRAGTVAFAVAGYDVQSAGLTRSDRDALTRVAAAARAGGLTAEIGGDALAPQPETGAAEGIGVLAAAVVLVVTFGSLVAAGLPLLTALLGIGIGVAGIQVATGYVDLSSNTPILATMIGLAVGIDYALFIVSRYRHEVALGRRGDEAAGRAVGTAGSAVVFAGLTVLIALAALSVVGIPFLTQMGLAAAGTVAVAVVVALTLLPAVLGFVGGRITRGIRGVRPRDPEADAGAGVSVGARWGAFVARRPLPVLLVAVAALGLVAVPAHDLRLGMPDDSTAAPSTTQRKAYDLVSSGFGPGFNGTLTTVVTAPAGQAPAAATAVARQLQALPDVVAVTPPVPNQAGDAAIVTVVPRSGPSDQATEDLVRAVRALDGRTAGVAVGVTGLTAVNIDISEKLSGAMLPYLAVVVGLALVLLLLVFRSVLVPVKAAAGFLLSMAATFGAVVAVFQWGWLGSVLGVQQTGPLISFLPIFLIGIVFGLAMDYEVFLVSRMAEEHTHGAAPKQAVVTGFAHGARVVLAAAIIMISVFAGFVASPESFIKSIGFALAVAVFFDALVVRMTIVPAVMSLLGRAAWWLPRWLDRVLPDVDVEGEKLRASADDEQPPTAAGPSLSGTVRAGDVAVAGAAVTLTDLAGRQVGHALADDRGRFRLVPSVVGSGSGTFLLICVAEGLQPEAAMVTLDGADVVRDVVLAGEARISGTLLDARGSVVPAGVLTLTDAQGTVVGGAVSDAAGGFAFPALAAGDYTLTGTAPGLRPAARAVHLAEGGAPRIELALAAGGALRGVVRSRGTGDPVGSADVTLVDAEGSVVGSRRTGEDGGYRFTDLAPGGYTLIASGFAPVTRRVVVDGGSGEPVDVVLGEQVADPQGTSDAQGGEPVPTVKV